MLDKIKKKLTDRPLAVRIRTSYMLVIIPMLILLIVSISILWNEKRRYDEMINAAGKASEFSLDFKNDFDYETYLVIVESKTFKESNLRNLISEATRVVDSLKEDVDPYSDNADRLDDAQKYLKNLSTYTDRIEDNLEKGYRYEENLEIWENDVQIVTALIRDTIIEFIYFEIRDVQTMRASMQQFYSRMFLVLIAICSLVVIMVIVISYYLSSGITRPIKRLSEVTRQVARGDLQVRANIEAGAEIGVLSDSLDKMIDQINLLFDQVKTEQIRLRKAELELLQAQINPHFLYNTLDTIVWLAEAGDQAQVVSMVGSLSNFFRTTLNEGRDVVTIRDELKHVNSYLQIQQVRYQDIMEYEVNVPDDIVEYTIPKITLQPLVENALYHGIKNKRGKGKITVSGEQVQNYLLLYVEDNGIGITEERLKQISDKINNADDVEGEVFGLHNVNERIRLKFGNRYGIHVDSVYGEGSKVSIMLPLEKITPIS